MKELKGSVILALLLLLSVHVVSAEPSFVGLINSDFKAGKISHDDAVIYKALAIQTPWILPEEYRPTEPISDGTLLVLEVLSELPETNPETQYCVKYLFASPKERENMSEPVLDNVTLSRISITEIGMIYYQAKTNSEYSTPEGHFVIHYSSNGKRAPNYDIKKLGEYLEESWSVEVDNLNYNPPDLGSNGKLDVFVWNLDRGSCGVAYPPILIDEGYILINNDFSWAINDDPAGDTTGAMKVTAAHEFFHHIQFKYINVLQNLGKGWWLDSSATFMEDEVFDEVNDYKNYLSSFYSSTDHSIGDGEYGGGYERVILNIFLKESYDNGNPDIIKEVLDELGVFTSPEGSVSKAVEKRGHNMKDFMHDFSLWNFMTGTRYQPGYYEEGSTFPTFNNFQKLHIVGLSNPSTGEQILKVNDLAANYVRFNPSSDLAETRIFCIDVKRENSQTEGWVYIRELNNNIAIKELSFGPDNKAQVIVDDFSKNSIKEVVLIVSIGDNDVINIPDTVKYSASLEQGIDLIFVVDTTGSMWNDISNVKVAANEIVNTLDASTSDYRVAVVDYRDFPQSPYGGSGDYSYHCVSAFSSDRSEIINAINSLSIGWGGDWQESVYSGVIRAIYTEDLGEWRNGVKKVVIVMGDAPPHDPEPFTGYTMDDVIFAAESVDPAIIYPIVIGANDTTYSYFAEMAERTSGEIYTASTASDVVEAILEAVGDIVEPDNYPPDVSWAKANVSELWPSNHKLIPISVTNVVDPDGDPVIINITEITQDEPVSGLFNGDKAPDGFGVGTDTALLRAERLGKGDGRVYKIFFIASDDKGARSKGYVLVGVPHDKGLNTIIVDSGQKFNSLEF